MSTFAELAKKAFEAYHNAPQEPAEWGLTDAFQQVVQFLAHHESVAEMPGLPEALQAMTPSEWETLRQRYPEHRRKIIDPLQRKSQNTL